MGVGKVKLIPFTDLTLLKEDSLQDNSSQFWTKLCGDGQGPCPHKAYILEEGDRQ